MRPVLGGRTLATTGGRAGSWAPSFKPYGLARGSWEGLAVAILTVALVVIFGADMVAPSPVEVTALALIVVIAAAWLLSMAPALWVAACAVALLGVEGSIGGLPPVTAAVEAVVFCSVAVSSRVYASRLRVILEGTDTDQPSVAVSVFGLENLAHLIDASADGVAAVDTDGRVRYANAAAIKLLGLPADSDRQPRLVDRIVPEDRSRVMAELGSPGSDGQARFSFRVRSRSGGLRDLECRHTQFWFRDRAIDGLVIWDMTEIKRLQLAADVLAETASNLAVTQPLELTFEMVARRVVDVAQASACAVLLLEGERTLNVAGSCGLPDGYAAAVTAASREGRDLPALRAIRTRTTVFVDDLPARIQAEPDLAVFRAATSGVPWHPAVAVPMVHNGRPLGVLAVYFLPGQRPDGPTLSFLKTIAGQAASAAQVSRLVAAAQDHVAAQERYRLSRELHDSLTQELYGIMLGAKSARGRLRGEPGSLAEPLDYILELANAGLADMRRLVLELRPEALDREGLVVALKQSAEAIAGRHRLQVHTEMASEPDVPLELKLVAYRVVQEALHNVVRHARAQHAWLRLAMDEDSLAIEVADDGMGFDSASSFPGHFGLASMRERAEGVGGTIAFESSPGGGTSMRLRLPIQAPATASLGAG